MEEWCSIQLEELVHTAWKRYAESAHSTITITTGTNLCLSGERVSEPEPRCFLGGEKRFGVGVSPVGDTVTDGGDDPLVGVV